MTQAVATIKDVAAQLAGIAGAERVSTDQEVLRRYGTDTDNGPMRLPDVVVSVLTTAEVQAVVRLANEWKMPVTPRSSGVGFYGAGTAGHYAGRVANDVFQTARGPIRPLRHGVSAAFPAPRHPAHHLHASPPPRLPAAKLGGRW